MSDTSVLGRILGRGKSHDTRVREDLQEKQRQLRRKAFRADLQQNRAYRKSDETRQKMVQLAHKLKTAPPSQQQQLTMRIGALLREMRGEQQNIKMQQQRVARLRNAELGVQRRIDHREFHADILELADIVDPEEAEEFAKEVETTTEDYAKSEETSHLTDQFIEKQMDSISDMQNVSVSQGDIDIMTSQIMQEAGLANILTPDQLYAIETMGAGGVSKVTITPAAAPQPAVAVAGAESSASTGFEDMAACLADLAKLEKK